MNPHRYLNSFVNFETHLDQLKGQAFDLSRMRQLWTALGNPQRNLRIIHVAGTKGKGSTCAFLSHILAYAGYRVGLYTSPHLHLVNERIRILHKSAVTGDEDFAGMITDVELEAVVKSVSGPIERMRVQGIGLTYFEALTAVAVKFFEQQRLDWVILETGLGGRLDATNALESMIAVLTPISLDHTKILGETLAEIASEKAGIIKNNRQKVVVAPQPEEALAVILKRCDQFGLVAATVAMGPVLDVSLKGPHQQENAATAMAVVKILKQEGNSISDEAVRQGLKHTRWPGRFELVGNDPVVIADGAHNGASARALAETLRREYPNRRVILVLGISKDKNARSFVAELHDLICAVIFTKSHHPRAHTFSSVEIEGLFKGIPKFIARGVKSAVALARRKANKEDIIVVTGSLFMASDARNACKLCTNTSL